MILLIDNYDSFVYNLARYVVELEREMIVKRCDEISIAEIWEMSVTHLILSPGPCDPQSAGITMQCVSSFTGKIPILGVCLGHQAIAAALGGKVVRAPKPMHGKSDLVFHQGKGILAGLPNPCSVGRYHSLIVTDLPECLVQTAVNQDGLIMALQHKTAHVYGVQFHPESVLTPQGKVILDNFLDIKPPPLLADEVFSV